MGVASPLLHILVGELSLIAGVEVVAPKPDQSGSSQSSIGGPLYNALLVNALVLPIANRMRIQSELEQLNRQIIQEGVGFIQTGGNPRVLQDLLASYIPPD
ncbi:MAG: hypothetical protein P8N94_00905 [Gammaproteobacteria bacterium]|nr:hypothetical protein [Gammaproteobacteria bacterium]